MAKTTKNANFSKGMAPFFKSHNAGSGLGGKKGISALMKGSKAKQLNPKRKKELVLKKASSAKSEFLLRKLAKGKKQGSRNGSLKKEGSMFGKKMGKQSLSRLGNEYGNDYGFGNKGKSTRPGETKAKSRQEKPSRAETKSKGLKKKRPKNLQIDTEDDGEQAGAGAIQPLRQGENISFSNNHLIQPGLNLYSEKAAYILEPL